jgi:hypothetical protein
MEVEKRDKRRERDRRWSRQREREREAGARRKGCGGDLAQQVYAEREVVGVDQRHLRRGTASCIYIYIYIYIYI